MKAKYLQLSVFDSPKSAEIVQEFHMKTQIHGLSFIAKLKASGVQANVKTALKRSHIPERGGDRAVRTMESSLNGVRLFVYTQRLMSALPTELISYTAFCRSPNDHGL
ncbi:hypothetical protein RRG08_031127 [Elysia crispata]|uniref:Uncharacterized protein n=1 Tax=Elysia crispata TaxID=231223 RepID=A0AAE0ZG66_9GAST|nr:hypothetical protein RRG08_031127 [Elysia crispata]